MSWGRTREPRKTGFPSKAQRWLGPAVFVVVFAVRAAYWSELQATPLSQWYLWQETDEHGYLDWSARLAGGSWLDVPAWRSYFSWQTSHGSPAVWESWYGKNAYFAGPLYPYALALFRVSFGSPIAPMRALQLLFACVASVLAALAARKILRRGAGEMEATVGGAVAGLLYGLYAPLVFHDGFIYRDGPVAHVSALLLFAPFLGSGRETRGRAFQVGLLGGFATLLKQTVAPVALGSVLVTTRRQRRHIGAALLGLALPLLALAARNFAAGVPPLTFDTRQAIGLAWGNARGADATTSLPPHMGKILEAAKGSTWKTGRLVLEGYRDAPLALPALWLKKLVTFFHAFEVPDNASFYFFRDRLPILRLLPVYACLLGPGLVGLVAARRARVVTGVEAALCAVAFATPLAACLLVQTTSRYRAAVAGPLAFSAGVGFGLAISSWRAGGRARVLKGAVAALLVSGITLLPPVIPAGKHRYADTTVYATILESRGSPQAAAEEVRRYLREGKDDLNRRVGEEAMKIWWKGDRTNSRVEPSAIAPPEKRFRSPGNRPPE